MSITAKPRVPTEYQECADFVRWLERHGLAFTHVPMGGKRDRKEASILARIGTKPGVPDYLIFSPPPGPVPSAEETLTEGRLTSTEEGRGREVVGVAVEMKRRTGGRVSKAQAEWIETLRACGWAAFVAHGARDAIQKMESLGYGRR